jgi:HAD superfamily hydrolase (TIGR01549 family)
VSRAVLFDIGDTLVHRPEVGPGRRIADALGLGRDEARTITRMLFRESFASPRALAARLRAAFALTDAIEEPIAAIWRAQETEPIEMPGATACVAAARAGGARVGLVSNIWAPYEAGFRRACPGIPPLVDSWHLSYRAGVAKPDPELFHAALRALDVAAGHAVMVGDSLDKDIAPALALGMRAIWIPLPDVAAATGGGDSASGAVDTDLATAAPAGATVVPDLDAARPVIAGFLAGARLV